MEFIEAVGFVLMKWNLHFKNALQLYDRISESKGNEKRNYSLGELEREILKS